MIHGSSPIQDGNVKACKQIIEVMNELKADIEKHYDKRPIILIVDSDEED